MKALLSKCLREFRPRWRRALDIVFIPSPAWRRVALEREGVATLFVGYVLPLSMIPALAWSFGLAFVARPGMTSIPLLTAAEVLRVGLVTALFSSLTPFWLAGLIRLLAPLFARPGDFAAAYRVAAHVLTPLWLMGILLAAPTLLVAVGLALVHSLYLMAKGIEIVLGAEHGESAEFTAIAVMGLNVVLMPLGWLAAWAGLL